MDYLKLKKTIETNKLGVTGLFKKLNINRGAFYYSIENETMKVETLEKICKILGLPVSDFFTDKNVLNEPKTPYGKEHAAIEYNDCEKELVQTLRELNQVRKEKEQLINQLNNLKPKK